MNTLEVVNLPDEMTWLRVFRRRVLNLILSIVAGLGGVGILATVVGYYREGIEFNFLTAYYFGSFAVVVGLLLARRMNEEYRAAGFLLLLYLFSVFSFVSGWLGGGGRTFLLGFIVLATILLGTRGGIIASVLSLVTFAVFGALYARGVLVYPLAPSFSYPPLIIVEGVGFAMAVGMVAIGLWFFREGLAAAERTVGRAEQSRQLADRQAAELKETNQMLAHRTEELEALNRELEAFSYTISHDLRAPARALNGFSRILMEEHAGQLDADGVRYLTRIQENAGRMGQLVDDLLAFTRLGRSPVNKQVVQPGELAQAVFAELVPPARRAAITFTVYPLPPCEADRALLRQVFTCLLSNAIKFTAPRQQATIEVRAYTTQGETVYAVCDNGVGFDMQYAGKLFGVFQRLHAQEEFEGTGVGLAMVQRIVQRHGGRVWAEAVEGQGAKFYFTLAPAPESAPEPGR